MSQWITKTEQPARIECWITAENIIRPEHLPEPDAEQALETGLTAVDSAKQEIEQGETISALILQTEISDVKQRTTLAMIRVWHYECGVEMLNKARQNFETAKSLAISDSLGEAAERQIRECKERIAAISEQKNLAEEFLSLQFQKSQVFSKDERN